MIAILSTNSGATLEWARKNLNARTTAINKRYLKGDKDQEYVIVSKEEHLYSIEISGYILAPGFSDWKLEDFAKTRIRK